MQIKIFTLPLVPETHQLEELNVFLRSSKVVDLRKEIATVDGNACWTFCVTYMQEAPTLNTQKSGGAARIDYKEVLDEQTFKRFSIMRRVRKDMAEAEAVPAYAIFTDAELAEVAKIAILVPNALTGIPGIGKKKVEKYGVEFCERMTIAENEEKGISDGEDSKP